MLPSALAAVLSLMPMSDARPLAAVRQVTDATALEVWAERLRKEGVELRNGKRPAEALAAFNASLALRPDNLDALGGRAKTYAALSRHDAAADDYARTVAVAPHDLGNWMGVADGWIARGKFAEAQKCFSRVTERVGSDRARCQALFEQSVLWLGVECGSAQASLTGPVAQVRIEYADVERASAERRSHAEVAVLQALMTGTGGNHVSRSDLFLLCGFIRLSAGRCVEAVTDFDDALALRPTDPNAHYWRARVALRQRDNPAAARHLELAERYGMRRAEVVPWVAGMHADAGELERAEPLLAELCALDPGNAGAFRVRGVCLRALGRDEAADVAAVRTARLAGTSVAVEMLSQAYSLVGYARRPADGDRTLTRLLERADLSRADRGLAYWTRGQGRFLMGRADDGYDDFTRAVRLVPEGSHYRRERLKQALHLKRYADAVEDADAFCRLAPYDLNGREWLRSARQPGEMLAAIAGRSPDLRPAGPVEKVPFAVRPLVKVHQEFALMETQLALAAVARGATPTGGR